MASALKRKRGLEEVVETQKRAKPGKEIENLLPTSQISQSGWEAAFNPPPKTKELITTNGVNGDGTHPDKRSSSPEAVEYEKFVGLSESELQEQTEERQGKEKRKLLKKVLATNDSSVWKLSEPIGGRQINVDPVFTTDEK
jgi:NET1-associated nuclear protein 1 (U3 small nucleolar RNA-associated protein 17)